MSENQRITRNPAIESGIEKKVNKLSKGGSGFLIQALWKSYKHIATTYFEYRWGRSDHFDDMHSAYKTVCGCAASACETLNEFFNPKLVSVLKAFFGKEETNRIKEECTLVMEFPYSHSAYRPSYRSCRAGDYADVFFMVMVNSIDFSTYGMTMEESLHTRDALLSGLDNRIALALRRGDKKVFAFIEEAVLGDNTVVMLNNLIISGIVKCGDMRALELLGKLLLAAKEQEGLRQAILETCDSGPLSSHSYFISLILENGLCRFSSVVRAFDTWTGLNYGDQKQKVAEKCMALAYKYLLDGSAISAGLDSNDTTEIYLALWVLGCKDIQAANSNSLKLLGNSEKYKRLVGWYFITHTNNISYRHMLAIQCLGVRDPEELAWVCINLYQDISALTNYYKWDEGVEKDGKARKYPNKIFPKSAEERLMLFELLASAAEFIGQKKTKFTESVFPWYTQELDVLTVGRVMLGLAAYDRSDDLIRRLSGHLHVFDSFLRLVFYSSLLDPDIPEQRQFLLAGLSDKAQTVRERVVNRLGCYRLYANDITELTGTLTTQNPDLRKGIITLLEKQTEALIQPAIADLLDSRNKNQLLAGVELLDIFAQKNSSLREVFQDRVGELKTNEKLSQDVSIILEQVVHEGELTDDFTAENGYGLFDPASDMLNYAKWANLRPQIPRIADKELEALLVPDERASLELYKRLESVFERYKDYEYETENWQGTREKVLLNDNPHWVRPLAGQPPLKHGEVYPISAYPLSDVWPEAVGEYATDKGKLAALLSIWGQGPGFRKEFQPWYLSLFARYPIDFDKDSFANRLRARIDAQGGTPQRANQILSLFMDIGEGPLFEFAFSMYVNLVRKIPEDQLGADSIKEIEEKTSYFVISPWRNNRVLNSNYLVYWRELAYKSIKTEADFRAYFNEMFYESLAARNGDIYGLKVEDICRAFRLGLISDEAVYYCLTQANDAGEHISRLTGTQMATRELLAEYPEMKALLAQAIDHVVTVEEKRGELPTPLTRVATRIERFEGGITHFVKLLTALGDTGFHRGYIYYWKDHKETTKKVTLSQLLRLCYPGKDATATELKVALKLAKISEKRAIQAAVYAPQWAGLLEQAMEITGLKCGVWFFHAHVNENFSAEKETEVAIYSAITPQQFNDGTFDKNWFFEAYETLGEKRFDELYKNAKYITDSSIAHRRSQLYADAVLGRMDKGETKAEIIDKRNQERLRAFALIPLDEGNTNDALERYEFIQQFKKESRQFGSLRQASEGKAVGIAMDNLAITTGFGDADRMTWALEGAKIEQMSPLMEPCLVGDAEADVKVWLSIEEDGTPELCIRKQDKQLKTLPKTLTKDPYILELKTAIKQLRDQKKRARWSFELAMVSRSQFFTSEITGLLGHPILRGMVSTLVLMAGVRGEPGLVTKAGSGLELPALDGNKLGFPALEGNKLVLIDPDGKKQAVADKDQLIIAHPYDFVSHKCWSVYQQYLFHNQIIQPFKQVFREYYPITEDELDAVNISRRYEGNQVQPKKTVALLKVRGWTVDYEEGLQRVWHKENLIVRMYAMADWFSPAEIEAPTLETIQFYRRDNYELVPFSDVLPVIFSETMRDIDLVVSVAHVGGVDPEASHSTVEMRIAIARELLSMLSVGNVSFQTAHAQITGNLGEYSVHMGSGVVHKAGTGMIAVLPVHSQSRGRIFLPFADDDPKTAEILSKILLFADDGKIKDPSILKQIKG